MVGPESDADVEERHDAERMKFFTDAVVAIAMTLLILPLLESVSEAMRAHEHTAHWVHEQRFQLFAFALSFVLIARFWISHERLFSHVEHWTVGLMLLNQAWMLTIVFLPVATALVGSLKADAAQYALYVGTLLLGAVLMTGMHVLVHRDPVIRGDAPPPSWSRLLGSATAVLMLVVAFVLALTIPGLGYFAMFVLFLSGLVERMLGRVLRPRWVTPQPRTPR